jgi:hypothetical protein
VCLEDITQKGGIMKKLIPPIVVVLIASLLVAGCAPTAVTPTSTPGTTGVAGFWKGLWHGFIVLFTFVISLFKDSVGIYETQNSGNLYNLGFLLGVMIFFGGSGRGACRKPK